MDSIMPRRRFISGLATLPLAAAAVSLVGCEPVPASADDHPDAALFAFAPAIAEARNRVGACERAHSAADVKHIDALKAMPPAPKKPEPAGEYSPSMSVAELLAMYKAPEHRQALASYEIAKEVDQTARDNLPELAVVNQAYADLDAAIEAENALLDEVGAMPAKTLQGIAFKAALIVIELDDDLATAIIRDVLALANIERGAAHV